MLCMDLRFGLMLLSLALSECTPGREGGRGGGVTGVHVVNLCYLQENSLVIHSPIPATHTLVPG